MKKTLIALSFIIIINLTGCEARNNPQEEIRRFYKTIPVVVTDIDLTWALKGNFKWSVRFKSDEYNIADAEEVSNWDSIGHNIYRGKLKKGDIIEAKMWTIKQGENIINRHIGNLIK